MLSSWLTVAEAGAGLRALPLEGGSALGLLGIAMAALFVALVAGLPYAATGDEEAGEDSLGWLDGIGRARLAGMVAAFAAIGAVSGGLAWAAWERFGLHLAFGLVAVAALFLLVSFGLALRALRRRV